MVGIFPMNLILIFPDELQADGRVHLGDARAEHIRTVLRAETGKRLRIGLLDGPKGSALVESVTPKDVVLACTFEAARPPRPSVDLLLAMPRPKVLKRLWSQFAALGVGRIFITNAEKVERYYFSTHVIEPSFYTPRLIEGLQQACDTRVPEVRVVRALKSFVTDELPQTYADATRLIADPSGSQGLVSRLAVTSSKRVLLAIGPEGGWTPFELDLFVESGFEAVGMGPRILRTDTASIALLSQVAAAREMTP
jgi:RsmE family RNA methyltransferase